MRFGKNPPKVDYRTLRFGAYLTPSVPPPPPADIELTQVYQKLGVSDPKELFPMDGNDRYGCCTIAALAHGDTVYDGLVGHRSIMAEREVLKLYFRLSGGIDSGLCCLDVLNYWRRTKIMGDKIIAYARIDPKKHDLVKLAITLFGGVYLGFQVQENALADFDKGVPWTPGRLTRGGHAVYATGYDPECITVLTWGNIHKGTWGWWDECVDEAYAILSDEARTAGFSPGFDFDQLRRDLAAVAS